MRKTIHILIVLAVALTATASPRYRFRVYLKEKGDEFSIEKPEAFLSEEAIARRQRLGIAVDSTDLPISATHLHALQEAGFTPIVSSKWQRTVVVECADRQAETTLRQLAMVDSVQFVWQGVENAFRSTSVGDTTRLVAQREPLKSLYGYALEQIKQLNGLKLHRAGFRGSGVRVAVIDAGFLHVDRIQAFSSLRLLGTHNVVNPEQSVFSTDEHGTKALSCLAAQAEGQMVGTAPEASYWLIKSEDSDSEYPIEEDYYAAALEFADSVGVDVITSSLGYFSFDADWLSHTAEQLDGQTAFISRAAHCAAEKGLLLFSSAGNEGNSLWRTITFPADAEGIVTVGAVTDKKQRSSFSSVGYTADGRVKPDFVALGTSSCVIDSRGEVTNASGTSFATPILAGMAVCLWQALPQLTPQELIKLLRSEASQCDRPDPELGYGLPNLYKAYKKGKRHAK